MARALLHAQPPMPPMSSADAFANLDEFEDERKEIERENAAHIRRMEHERTMRDNAQGSKKATTETSGGLLSHVSLRDHDLQACI